MAERESSRLSDVFKFPVLEASPEKKQQSKTKKDKDKDTKESNVNDKPIQQGTCFSGMSEITYLGTGKVKKFDSETLSLPADMMCSYSENVTNTHVSHSDTITGWIEHNKGHLSRIYPKGLRIDSSNYDPVPAWYAGNQLVALNYQTNDEGKWANFGKFKDNGNCGYVMRFDMFRYV
jgi:hypothetical protein